MRGIIALQAAPALPRHLVRLWPQAGRQESQQAGQVDVGEAQQGHNQKGKQSTRVEKGGGMRGRAHTCSPRQSKSSLIMPYEWTAALGAAAGRSAAAWSESVVLPAQVLRPIHACCGFRSIGDARWRFAAHWVMERVYLGTQTSANQPEKRRASRCTACICGALNAKAASSGGVQLIFGWLVAEKADMMVLCLRRLQPGKRPREGRDAGPPPCGTPCRAEARSLVAGVANRTKKGGFDRRAGLANCRLGRGAGKKRRSACMCTVV